MSKTKSIALIAAACALSCADLTGPRANPFSVTLMAIASAEEGSGDKAKADDKNDEKGGAGAKDQKEKTPEQKMQARFPQPARVDHLIGLPVLDDNDSTIGFVQQVVRTPEGKIQLIVPYSKRFGWAQHGPLTWGKRPVAVPIEVVAILARQIDSIDMDRAAFEKAPTWETGQTKAIQPSEIVKIALGRR